MNSFSAKDRSQLIGKMNNSSFDLVVIGGGITGAGIALDATSRGLKVLLVEMQDFASGTSGRSTKLIHGGLRYLKQLEFKLVAEVGKERDIIHRISPHLTRPELMLLPIIKNGSLGKFSARIGMAVYERLAGVKREERHRFLNASETLNAEPVLKKNNLLGGILFYEYRTDDSRLTLETIKEAVNRNAIALNYMKSVSFIYENDFITGVMLQDQLNGEPHEVKAKYIVNAAGPWVDEVSDLDKTKHAHKLQITKGVHIVVDHKKLPVKQSLYFDTFDKRMIFVIPRNKKTYIGTTDTFYSGSLENPQVTEADKDYLLKCINENFTENKLVTEDIESVWAGLRPLVAKAGKKPSEISRKDETFESPSGLITIAGGKLTGYRKMAQRITDLVAKKILLKENKKLPSCSTHLITLPGGKTGNLSFGEFVKTKINAGQALGLSAGESEILCGRYGSNVDEVYDIIKTLKSEESQLSLVLRAQIVYAVENEMCIGACDFLMRRTGIFYFDAETVKTFKAPLLAYIRKVSDWNDSLYEKFRLELETATREFYV